jgi:hypothetical protein
MTEHQYDGEVCGHGEAYHDELVTDGLFMGGRVAFYEGKPMDRNAPKLWRMGYAMERDLTTQDSDRGDPRDDEPLGVRLMRESIDNNEAQLTPDDGDLFQAMCDVAYRTYKTPSVFIRGTHAPYTVITAGDWEWNIDNEDERRAFVDWANRLRYDSDATPTSDE